MGGLTGCCGGKLMGSVIGGIKNTQAVVDLCARANIVPERKVMPCEKVNEIYSMLDSSNDAGLRYVLDLGTLNGATAAKCSDLAPPTIGPGTPLSICSGLCEVMRILCCCKCW